MEPDRRHPDARQRAPGAREPARLASAARRVERELRSRDFASARRSSDRLADEATYCGRYPDIAIHDDGRILISLAGANHAGVTVADLALADVVDCLLEAEARG